MQELTIPNGLYLPGSFSRNAAFNILTKKPVSISMNWKEKPINLSKKRQYLPMYLDSR